MDALQVADWMRDASDVELLDFINAVQSRLTAREFEMWKHRAHGRVSAMKRRQEEALRLIAERERRERPHRIRAQYAALCEQVLGAPND